jgi:hypothetical protein
MVGECLQGLLLEGAPPVVVWVLSCVSFAAHTSSTKVDLPAFVTEEIIPNSSCSRKFSRMLKSYYASLGG